MGDINKKNKEEFMKPLKKLIVSGTREKGIIFMDGIAIAAFIMAGYIKKIPATSGTWYQLKIGELETQYALMEVKAGIFKVVLLEDVKSLDRYHWHYNNRNVYTYISADDVRNEDPTIVYLERVILDLHKYGQGIVKDTAYDAHHMWFRWCAVESMLKSLDKKTHWAGHKTTGNYSRSQCIKINNEDDYLHFMKKLMWAHKLLKTKQFSIEI